jgi:hypothetical protein
MTTPLTLTHLRFDATALSPIRLGGFQAGERLRDALAGVILNAVCPEVYRRAYPTPEHAAVCPACWLLAANLDPGEVRRLYALVPPLPPPDVVESGGRFSFVITLFGEGLRFLPYFVLASPEMGRRGVGPGRGRFELEAISAIDPLKGEVEAVWQRGENLVRPPAGRLSWETALAASQQAAGGLEKNPALQIDFLTPTRLIEDNALLKSPDFGVLFRRLLKRIDELAEQFCGQGPRSSHEIEALHTAADRVRLVESEVAWTELWGPSNRTGRRTPMGGFTGRTVYRARDWSPLLPWLVMGQGVQAGKLAVKGNGVFQSGLSRTRPYWESVMSLGLAEKESPLF